MGTRSNRIRVPGAWPDTRSVSSSGNRRRNFRHTQKSTVLSYVRSENRSAWWVMLCSTRHSAWLTDTCSNRFHEKHRLSARLNSSYSSHKYTQAVKFALTGAEKPPLHRETVLWVVSVIRIMLGLGHGHS